MNLTTTTSIEEFKKENEPGTFYQNAHGVQVHIDEFWRFRLMSPFPACKDIATNLTCSLFARFESAYWINNWFMENGISDFEDLTHDQLKRLNNDEVGVICQVDKSFSNALVFKKINGLQFVIDQNQRCKKLLTKDLITTADYIAYTSGPSRQQKEFPSMKRMGCVRLTESGIVESS